MKIKVLKDIEAASCPKGISTRLYKSGESIEIFDELANVFISQGWGELEQKAISKAPENKAILSIPENKFIEQEIKEVVEEAVIEEPKKKGRPKK